MRPVSYLSVLRRLGVRPTARYPWAVVGRTRRRQGWKLHLSSVQVQAPRLLRAVVPALRAQRVSFKVAQDERVLGLLNEGEFGPTQVGKFLTIYPDSDAHARRLAERLVSRTRSFAGPEIVTDLRLGSVVYARHGSFNPVIRRDRLGLPVRMIDGPDAALVPDRYTVPFSRPAHVSDPFEGLGGPRPARTAIDRSLAPNRIVGGYLLVRPIRVRPYGGAFLSIDLRRRATVGLKVLKFGRPHCLSDAVGRDIRDRLQRQGSLHTELSKRLPVPAADRYFEVDGYGFVAFAHVEGRDFEHLIARKLASQPWECLPRPVQRRVLGRAGQAIDAVRRLHAAGYVHRDLSPSNLWLADDGKVYLLDLELAYPIGGSEPPFGLGTAGFMSPQQEAREAPRIADDVFAIGSLLTLLLTRLDPRRVVFEPDHDRRWRLRQLAAGAPPELLDVVCACLSPDPDDRPSLAAVASAVADHAGWPRRHRLASISGARSRGGLGIEEALERGVASLVAEARESGGVWRSAPVSERTGRAGGVYQVERYANRGVAGVVYLLAHLARARHASADAARCASLAARWLMAEGPSPVRALPGLHFGEAGVAVAIAEAIAAGLLPQDRRVGAFVAGALTGVLDWPDITHGAAGQGVAALYCARRLGDPGLADFAHRCAEYLLATQSRNGSWTLPPGVEGMSGQTLTGFAHGTAGIAYFLAEYTHRFDRPDALRALERATAWLAARAHRVADGLEWSYGAHTRERWHWWCHGGPGIALAFLKLYEHTGERRHASVARGALRARPARLRYPNLTQCHGSSGLGEIYLEASRVLREDEWRDRAASIAADLLTLARAGADGGLSWLAEDPYRPTPDLMVGYGGILHFLLRLKLSDRGTGYPLLLEPEP